MAKRKISLISGAPWKDKPEAPPAPEKDDAASKLDALEKKFDAMEKKLDELTKITTGLPDTLLRFLTS